MVSMDHFVMVAAQVPATVGAELGRRLAATLLMLLQLFSATEPSDISNLQFLACLEGCVECEAWTRFQHRWRSLSFLSYMGRGSRFLVSLGL